MCIYVCGCDGCVSLSVSVRVCVSRSLCLCLCLCMSLCTRLQVGLCQVSQERGIIATEIPQPHTAHRRFPYPPTICLHKTCFNNASFTSPSLSLLLTDGCMRTINSQTYRHTITDRQRKTHSEGDNPTNRDTHTERHTVLK